MPVRYSQSGRPARPVWTSNAQRATPPGRGSRRAGTAEPGSRPARAVGVGAEPAEDAEVLNEHPVRQAQRHYGDERRADQPRPPAQEHRAGQRERSHHDHIDRESVPGIDRAEPGHQGRQEMRLRDGGHRLDHAGERAWPAVPGPLPEPAAWPGLQYRHPGQEQAYPGEDQPARPRGAPRPGWQRDQCAGHRVAERGPRRAGQPAQAGGEDAPRRTRRIPRRPAPSPGWPAGPAATTRHRPRPAARFRCRPGSRPRRLRPVPGGKTRWSRPGSRLAAPSAVNSPRRAR